MNVVEMTARVTESSTAAKQDNSPVADGCARMTASRRWVVRVRGHARERGLINHRGNGGQNAIVEVLFTFSLVCGNFRAFVALSEPPNRCLYSLLERGLAT